MVGRLLMAARGSGGFTVPPIPEKGRWARQGTVLVAAATWEGLGILEPSVLYESSTFKMWYRGGGLHGPTNAFGYATSSDGLTWTKGTNPQFGNGTGGEASNVICPTVVKVGATYYLYYSRLTDNTLKVATSSDGLTWTIQGTTMAKPAGFTYWGNTSVWNEGATWKMLVEAYVTAAALWKIHYATSSDGIAWTMGNSGNPLTSLSVGGMYGGPNVQTISGVYQCWYHAATSGNLPTDLYRAYSTDAINWTVVTPNPLLTHLGSAYEIDQIADPAVVEVGGTSYLFYDADDNTTDIAAIKVATFAGTLAQIVAGW